MMVSTLVRKIEARGGKFVVRGRTVQLEFTARNKADIRLKELLPEAGLSS